MRAVAPLFVRFRMRVRYPISGVRRDSADNSLNQIKFNAQERCALIRLHRVDAQPVSNVLDLMEEQKAPLEIDKRILSK